jgi:hypothetical protein
MASKTEIGVLLVDKASGEQIGFIEFDSRGIFAYHIIKKGMHVFGLKGIDRLLREEWATQPLYKKHAALLDGNSKLSDEILKQEAKSCADFLNSQESPPMVGGYVVTAQVVVREI